MLIALSENLKQQKDLAEGHKAFLNQNGEESIIKIAKRVWAAIKDIQDEGHDKSLKIIKKNIVKAINACAANTGLKKLATGRNFSKWTPEQFLKLSPSNFKLLFIGWYREKLFKVIIGGKFSDVLSRLLRDNTSFLSLKGIEGYVRIARLWILKNF